MQISQALQILAQETPSHLSDQQARNRINLLTEAGSVFADEMKKNRTRIKELETKIADLGRSCSDYEQEVRRLQRLLRVATHLLESSGINDLLKEVSAK